MADELPADLARVFPPFVALLNSPCQIDLAQDTLYGAITHFLSVLPTSHLGHLVQALVTSPSLQSRSSSAGDTDEPDGMLCSAVVYAVGAKAALVRQSMSGAYFQGWRSEAQLRKWLTVLIKSLPSDLASLQSLREAFLAGLLQGAQQEEGVKWTSAREELELEVTSTIDARLTSGAGLPSSLCLALSLLDDSKVQLLDSQTLCDALLNALRGHVLSFASLSEKYEASSEISRALTAVIRALSNGSSRSMERAVDLSTSFLQILQEATCQAEEQWLSCDQAPEPINTVPHKTLLFTLLLPALSILDHILLVSSTALTSLATGILDALANMAYFTAGAAAGVEGWERLFYGCLDVVDASKVQLDLRAMSRGPSADYRAAFVLVVAEQLMPRVDVGVVLRLAETYLQRPAAKPAFEAAHAVVLALLRGASASKDSRQDAFTEELIRFYAAVVLQTRSQDLTSDQTRAAYPEVLKAAAALSVQHAQQALAVFDDAYAVHPSQTLRLTRAAMIPHVPTLHLPSFLNILSAIVLEASDADKAALTAVIFRIILEELGDEGKVIGMAWWLDQRDGFHNEIKSDPALQAKL